MSFKENFKKKMNDNSYEEHLMKNYLKKRERAEDRANAYSYFLAAVCVILAVMFVIYGSWLLGMIFVGAAGLLVILVYLSKNAEENDRDKNKKE